MNNKSIGEKRKKFLEYFDEKLRSLNIKKLELYEKYIGGNSWKKRIKRLIFCPDILLKNKFKIIKKKFFQEIPERNDHFLSFLKNLDSTWELRVIKFLIKNLKENDIFYDIGAERGLYTSLALEFCKEVHAFEPLPQLFNDLKENFSKYKNLYLNQVAISDLIGEVKITLDTTTIVEDIKKIYKKKSDEINIKTLTLDEYIKTHNPPSYIKMDIEGAEYLAIKGATNLLKTHSPIIIMEVLGDEFLNNALKAVDLLSELEYKPYKLDYDGNIFEADYQEIKTQKGIYNYIFKKSS